MENNLISCVYILTYKSPGKLRPFREGREGAGKIRPQDATHSRPASTVAAWRQPKQGLSHFSLAFKAYLDFSIYQNGLYRLPIR